MKWNKQALEAWLEEASRKDEDAMIIQKYSTQDDLKTKVTSGSSFGRGGRGPGPYRKNYLAHLTERLCIFGLYVLHLWSLLLSHLTAPL